MLNEDGARLDGLRTYIDGKLKRYNLLFAVNGAAFAIAKLATDRESKILLGHLTVSAVAWGAISFTVLMTVDIWLWARMMKKNFRGPLAFNRPGKGILLLLSGLIIVAWVLAAL